MPTPIVADLLPRGDVEAFARVGAVVDAAGFGKSAADPLGMAASLMDAGTKGILYGSVLLGIPVGIMAHMINRHVATKRLKERELDQRLDYYRNAGSGIEHGLAGMGVEAAARQGELVKQGKKYDQLLKGLGSLSSRKPYMEVASTEVLRHRMPQLKLGLLEHTLAPGEGLNLPVRDLLENLRNNPEWRKLLLGGNVDDLMAAVLSKTRAALREPKVASADPAPVNYGTAPGSETRLMDYEAAKRKWKAVKDPHSPEAQVAAAKADALKKVGPPSMAKRAQLMQRLSQWWNRPVNYGKAPYGDLRLESYKRAKEQLAADQVAAGQSGAHHLNNVSTATGPAADSYIDASAVNANRGMDIVNYIRNQVKDLGNADLHRPQPRPQPGPTGDVQVAKTP